MTTTETAGDHAGDEHTSRWPLVTAVGTGLLYAGGGLALVGPDLVPVALSVVLVGAGALGVVGGLAGWLSEAFLADYWGRTVGETGVYTGGMWLFLVTVLYVGAELG